MGRLPQEEHGEQQPGTKIHCTGNGNISDNRRHCTRDCADRSAPGRGSFKPECVDNHIDEHADNAKNSGQDAAEGKQHSQTGYTEHDGVHQHYVRLQPAGRQTAFACPFHFHIQITVEIVVKYTGRGHHQHGSQEGQD
ncbi:hypothetical protein D3C80_1645410 [compost metagenome]